MASTQDDQHLIELADDKEPYVVVEQTQIAFYRNFFNKLSINSDLLWKGQAPCIVFKNPDVQFLMKFFADLGGNASLSDELIIELKRFLEKLCKKISEYAENDHFKGPSVVIEHPDIEYLKNIFKDLCHHSKKRPALLKHIVMPQLVNADYRKDHLSGNDHYSCFNSFNNRLVDFRSMASIDPSLAVLIWDYLEEIVPYLRSHENFRECASLYWKIVPWLKNATQASALAKKLLYAELNVWDIRPFQQTSDGNIFFSNKPKERTCEYIKYVFNHNFNRMELIGLYRVPESIGLLNSIRDLTISFTKSIKLPDSIGFLTNLEMLKVHGNKIKSLPDSIGHCVNLISLDASNNSLRFLPGSLCNLTNLQTLLLGTNQIENLPDKFHELTLLQGLGIEYNHMQALPPLFTRLVNLKVLNLNANRFNSLPPNFSELTNLFFLDLSSNPNLKNDGHLFSALTRCPSLECLYLNNLGIQSLPLLFGQLTVLKYLRLYENDLESPLPNFGRLEKLKELNVASNPRLSILPDQLERLSNLRSISIEGTLIDNTHKDLILKRCQESHEGTSSFQALSLR